MSQKAKRPVDVAETLNEKAAEVVVDGEGEFRTTRRRKRKATEAEKMECDKSTATKRPNFLPLKRGRFLEGTEQEMRKIPVPPHRYSPLKENWLKIFTPVVEHLCLQIRFNLKTRHVELRNTPNTKDDNALQKGADFIRAFTLGFDVADSLALLRLDDLFIDSFDVKDVKPLKGDHLSRAIGRVAGKGGKTKYTIENVTKTRIVLADFKVHIMGSCQNIAVARRAICNLILGSPPSKVYGNLRALASRVSERF